MKDSPLSRETTAKETPIAPPQPPMEKPLTAAKAAEILQIHPKTLVKFAKQDKVPSKRIGSVWRFMPIELDPFLRGHDLKATK